MSWRFCVQQFDYSYLIIIFAFMRLVKEVPHERYKIQIFHYNGKYIVKIDLGQFEQSFKIGETDVTGIADVEKLITPLLLSNSLNRFLEMRNDWTAAFNELNNNNE